MRKIGFMAATMVAAALAAAPVAAMAAPQSMASGGGKTSAGASWGFNAKADDSGSFNYVGPTQYAVSVNGTTVPAGSSFHGHCFSYDAVNFVASNQARLFATCRGFFFVQGGPPLRTTVYLQAHVIDNGEPGTNDRACIAWGFYKYPGIQPPKNTGLVAFDCGTIQNGNIQVKTS